jgi:hypothetical protein
MRNIQTLATPLTITAVLSALALSGYLNGDARADYVWSVGSQLSQIVASQNNSVYVVWQNNNSPDQNVYFRRSADGGSTFDRVVRLSDSAPGGSATDPHMAVSGNYVYVVWMDRRQVDENFKVIFRRSMDGGGTFESPQILSNNAKGPSGILQLISSEGRLYAIIIDEWAENGGYFYDVELRESADDGKTFGSPVSLLPALSHWNMRSVSSVAVSSGGAGGQGMVYAVGVDYGSCSPEQANCGDDAKIFFRRSTDSGEHFTEPISIHRPPGIVTKSSSEIHSQPPAWLQVAAADGNHVSIVWGEFILPETREAIFLSKSSDGGRTFEDPVRLDAKAEGSSDFPLLISSSSNTYVAWNGRASNNSLPHIALTRIRADESFGEPVDVNGKATNPTWDITASGKNVYVAWGSGTKNVAGLPDGTDVYFLASGDEGGTFANTIDLSDDNALKTLFAAQKKPLSFVAPKIAASGTHVYVGWQPAYPDSNELFFRASSDGGRTFGNTINLNAEASDPVSRGLSFVAEYGTYLLLLTAALGTVALVLFVKRRGGIR